MYNAHLARITNRPGERLQILLNRNLCKRLLEYVDPEKKPRLLEIGTGAGRTAIELVRLGFHYTGIEPTKSMRDFSLSQISSATNNVAASVIEGSLPNLNPDELGKFDAIVMFHVLEHAENYGEAYKWIENCKNLLSEDGILYLLTPSFKHYGWIFWDIDRTHQYPTSLNRIMGIAQEVGLETLEYRYVNSWLSIGPVGDILSWFSRRILPVRLIDGILRKLLKHNQLFSGLLVGFVLSNCIVIARKREVE